MNPKKDPKPFPKEQANNTLGIDGLSTHPNALSKRTNTELPIEFGRYRLLKVLGEGGMGAVYLAHDTELDRKVALKLPHFGGGKSKNQGERFRREARLAANLSHPNICRIHDIGQHDAHMYLTMEYIEGKTLNDVIKAKGAVEPRIAVNLMKRIATAVQFAHAQGIIHRDLKPANVMIKRDRDFVLMDFGLARRIDQDDVQLTATGAVLGTPAYMAPEQLRGENTEVGPQADVYSLGIMLFELLTGQRPFQGTLPQIYAQVLTTESVAPSSAQPGLDPALDEMCRKATNRDVSKRFKSASEFARALEEYLQPQSIQNKDGQGGAVAQPKPSNNNMDVLTSLGEIDGNRAKPKTKLTPKPKSKRTGWFSNNRNRVGVGIGILLLLAFTGLLGVILTIKTANGTIEIEGMPEDGDVLVDGNRVEIAWNKGAERAEIAINPGTHQLKVLVKGVLVQGETVVIQPDKKTTVTIKSKGLPTMAAVPLKPSLSPMAPKARAESFFTAKLQDGTFAGGKLVRELQQTQWPVDLLRREDIPLNELRTAGHGDPANAPKELVAVIGDSRWKSESDIVGVDVSKNTAVVVSGNREGLVTVYDNSGYLLRQFQVTEGTLTNIRLDREGTRCITSSSDQLVRLWDVANGKKLREFSGHRASVADLEYSFDEQFIYSVSNDKTLRVWNVQTGICEKVLSNSKELTAVAAHPSLGVAAVAEKGDTLRVWDLDTSIATKDLKVGKRQVTGVAFSPDGLQLAASSDDGNISVWDISKDYAISKTHLSSHPPANAIHFSDDSTKIAIAGSFGQVWDLESDKIIGKYGRLPAVGNRIVPFGAQWLMAWSTRWMAIFNNDGVALNRDTAGITAFALSPDGTNIAVTNRDDERIDIWNLEGQPKPRTIVRGSEWDDSILFTSDQQSVITAGGNWRPKFWDIGSGRTTRAFGAHANWIFDLDMAADGARLATSSHDSKVCIWDIKGGESILSLKGDNQAVYSVRFSPDAKRLVSSSNNGLIKIWNSATGKEQLSIPPGRTPRNRAIFRPFGQEIAVADGNDILLLLLSDSAVTRTRTISGHSGGVAAIDFNMDGSQMISVSHDGTVRVWDANSGLEVKQIRIQNIKGELSRVRFTPDGRHAITRNGNGTCYVLRLN